MKRRGRTRRVEGLALPRTIRGGGVGDAVTPLRKVKQPVVCVFVFVLYRVVLSNENDAAACRDGVLAG